MKFPSTFVIRGNKGTRFTSTDLETPGNEVTYKSMEQAENALEQIQPLFRDEKFSIKDIKKGAE
jgi:hypothetical protein